MGRVTWSLVALLLMSACPNAAPHAVDSDGRPNPKAPAQLLNNHANSLDDAGKHAQAVLFYEAALARYPSDDTKERAGAHYNLGLALRRLGEFEASAEHYARAIELNPAAPAPYLNISVPLGHLGRYDEAIAYLRAGRKRNPDDLMLLESLANTLIELNRHGEALPLAREAFAARKAVTAGDNEHVRWLMRWANYIEAQDAK